MSTYKILSDTSCDIPAAVLEQLDVTYVPFHVSFDTVQYLKELQDITPDEFYDKINAEKIYPKTSLPSMQDYMDAMEPVLQEGKDVFCICLTANFSGSYQSGVNAANILSEAYPERKIMHLLPTPTAAEATKYTTKRRGFWSMKHAACAMPAIPWKSCLPFWISKNI